MHSQIVELVSELGLVLPSPGTDEYSLLGTMALPQALTTVTLAAKNDMPLDALLRSMQRRMRSLTPLDTESPPREPTSTPPTSPAWGAPN